MTTTELLIKFGDPDIIQTLSTSDKLYAGMMATVLGMGITFASLIILQFAIVLMEKLLNRPQEQTLGEEAIPATTAPLPKGPVESDNELIAVISSVIALQLKTSISNIVIRNIEKVETPSPAWNRAGILEQMSSRL
ncbi:MAG: OadG family protein [Deltaproteobacteria bacterium]|nr:OadG family protein [Deltaproteobacteria bacterium]